jgi:hypothetical protein
VISAIAFRRFMLPPEEFYLGDDCILALPGWDNV